MPALHSKEEWRQAREELHEQLVDWDPFALGASGAPRDEYDVLVFPLMRRLDEGADAEETAHWLAAELPRRFGSTPSAAEIANFSRRLTKWFHARWPTPTAP